MNLDGRSDLLRPLSAKGWSPVLDASTASGAGSPPFRKLRSRLRLKVASDAHGIAWRERDRTPAAMYLADFVFTGSTEWGHRA